MKSNPRSPGSPEYSPSRLFRKCMNLLIVSPSPQTSAQLRRVLAYQPVLLKRPRKSSRKAVGKEGGKIDKGVRAEAATSVTFAEETTDSRDTLHKYNLRSRSRLKPPIRYSY